MTQRGIIITPSRSDHDRGTRFQSIDPCYLRQCAVYWDVIDCPNNVVADYRLEANRDEIDLLASEHMFVRTRGHFVKVESDGKRRLLAAFEDPDVFWDIAQLYTFAKRRGSDINWSIGQMGEELSISQRGESFLFIESSGSLDASPGMALVTSPGSPFPCERVTRGQVIEVRLHNSLPVPSSDVPMEEILEFRQQRIAELQSLRAAMDEFHLQILETPDVLQAEADVVCRIDRALADIEQVMGENRIERIYATARANLSSPAPLVRDAAISAGIGWLIGGGSIPLALLSSAAGTVGSTLTASVVSAIKPVEIPDELSAYSYLYHVQSELGP